MDKYFAKEIKDRQKQGYPKNELGFQRSLFWNRCGMSISTREQPTMARVSAGPMCTRCYSLACLFWPLPASISSTSPLPNRSRGRGKWAFANRWAPQRGQLFGQIWGETLLLCFGALLIGLGLAYVLFTDLQSTVPKPSDAGRFPETNGSCS